MVSTEDKIKFDVKPTVSKELVPSKDACLQDGDSNSPISKVLSIIEKKKLLYLNSRKDKSLNFMEREISKECFSLLNTILWEISYLEFDSSEESGVS